MAGSDFPVCGVLLVDKPVGPTSFAVVRQVRRGVRVKKVGHAGSLDPFASGLLVVCVGRPATRLSGRLMAGRKHYRAEIRLGVETDTYDAEGQETARRPVEGIDRQRVEAVLSGFRGEIMQAPPPFSALKHQGRPLYYYARRGEPVHKEPRPVRVHRLDLLSLAGDRLVLDIECGKGTYVRSLAADLGRELGCGAHLAGLRRLAVGPFAVEQAVDGARLDTMPAAELAARLLPVARVEDLLAATLPDDGDG